ncbi:Sds3-like family protein Dep1 [Schizosaccharomyces japonicus yFS275]|uniref:Sds3-like family protein Dep1 n=1 Tax=Schizosaccharomyces japonicus (strain yFS275 / FY16936) TaxID=402676 RepID=B6K042_SCHJY|nr:Sds3-like family protein Dep1 [Schizosaccharomyces japonicus yFS275]EEB06192.1 Sds3-like family protein Dep1 [Schizosaccharomyces japonicus yFS275]
MESIVIQNSTNMGKQNDFSTSSTSRGQKDREVDVPTLDNNMNSSARQTTSLSANSLHKKRMSQDFLEPPNSKRFEATSLVEQETKTMNREITMAGDGAASEAETVMIPEGVHDEPALNSSTSEQRSRISVKEEDTDEKMTTAESATDTQDTIPKATTPSMVSTKGRKRKRRNDKRTRQHTSAESAASSDEEKSATDSKVANDSHDGEDEKTQKRKEALDALVELEMEFSILRQRLFGKKLARLTEQERLIEKDVHPRLNACMDFFLKKRDKRLDMASKLLKFQLSSIDKFFAFVVRQRHFQYRHDLRKLRQLLLNQTSARIYQLQRDMGRSLSRTPSANAPNPYRWSAVMFRQQSERQAAMLSELNNAVGFPAAAQLEGVSAEEAASDLRELGISLTTDGS